MKRFLTIRPGITRCTYTPEEQFLETSDFIAPALLTGTEIREPPAPITQVTFEPRAVYESKPEGEPILRVVKTVDGQRTVIDNLKKRKVRDAWRAHIQLQLQPAERIYGFGQDEDGLLQKQGTVVYGYQHNMRIPVPMLVSNLGYAILADCGCLFRFDSRQVPAEWTLECVQQVDLYVLRGTMDEIVAAYRELTGQASPMPVWALGYWQSRERYTSQEELLQVARRYREAHVPLDVVVQDWKTWEGDLWGDKHLDRARFPDVRQLKKELHDLHVHSLVSVWPNLNQGGRDHAEMARAGFLLNDYSTYDAFDPAARALYWQQAARELYPGFDGWWCDSTEPFTAPDWCGPVRLPEEKRYALVGGEHEAHLDPVQANCYALAHARGIWENQPEKPVVNLTRSGWTGCQQYGTVLWAGDTSATWRELRREIVKGISVGLCGLPWWTVDCGGFFTGGTACWRKWCGNEQADPVWFWAGIYDQGVKDPAYAELYTRWLQFCCFLPIFRSHGTDTPREFWNFEEPYRSAIVDTIRLRYQLMPYLKKMARQVTEEHFTILRGLMFDFPRDAMSWTVEDEFMFGRDLLICPVTQPMEESRTRRCWLPSGTLWYEFWTGTPYMGGQTVPMDVSLEHIPVFIRGGAELPLCEGLEYADDMGSIRMRYGK